jgi:MoaA/NifB/PqqE/SkfB family radical SAM enzyme
MCPRQEISRPFGTMNRETLQIIVDRALAEGVRTFSFSGFGEPLLNPEIVEFIKYIKEKSPKTKVNITTNGALLKPAVADALILAGLDEIQISFNGWDKKSYESIMKNLSFEEIMSNLQYLLVKTSLVGHPKTQILPVISKVQKETDYQKIINLFSLLKISQPEFPGCFIVNNRAGFFENPEIFDQNFYRELGINFRPPEEIVCLIPFQIYWLDWQGFFHLCCNDLKNLAILGDVRTRTFGEIEKIKLSIASQAQVFPLCSKCNLPFLLGENKGFILKNKG